MFVASGKEECQARSGRSKDRSQPRNTAGAGDADGTRVNPNDGANILGQPDFTGEPNEHISSQQRAGEIAYYLQQA